ncbi:MAG TPA: hypothetical protein VIM59_18300 [Cellvibrio sp.]
MDETLELSTQEELSEMFGAPPDKSIKNWVRLDILGRVNHPFPYIWVSPQAFVRHPPYYVIKVDKLSIKNSPGLSVKESVQSIMTRTH